jgi:Flp pilus assembly protein CpaB
MRRLATGVGLVSLLLAVAFTFMLINRGMSSSGEEQVTVVVPGTTIHQRDPLDTGSGQLKEQKAAKATADPDALHSLKEADGLYATFELTPGTPLVKGKNVDTKEGMMRALGVLDVRPGYRAMSVQADRLSVISGALKPGDFVDVLAANERNGITFSRVALSGVKVLMVGAAGPAQKPATGPDGKPVTAIDQNVPTTVTLELTQAQARDLNLATQKGKIQLVLCSMQTPGGGSSAGGAVVSDADLVKKATEASARAQQAGRDPAPSPVRVATQRPIRGIPGGHIPSFPDWNPAPLPPRIAQPVGGGTVNPAVAPAPPVRGAAPEQHVVTIIRGDTKSTQAFQGN